MMRQLIIGAFICILGLPVFSQPAKREIHQGNELYKQQKYAEAEALYKQSVDKSKESLQGNFNLGDAWYKQKKYDDAIGKFTDIASASKDKGMKAQAYHNLGNSLLSSNKLEESIAAYKKSLMNNPKDEQTRYNLAYAQEKLKQQQNKDNKDKDKNNKDNKDKKDQQNKDNKDNKDQQNKDKKDQQDKDKKDQQDKDNKDQQNKDPDKNDPNKDQQGQQPKPDQLSKDDAERLLDALNQEEKKTQDKLKDKKAKGVKGRITKQW